MDLILWRHAEAEDGLPDHARRLTAKGRRQAARVAQWLVRELGQPRVLVSPAVRAQETAQALALPLETCTALDVGRSAEEGLGATGWPDASGSVVVVGHQPTLGRTAALLLCGREDDWAVKKGAIWWFTSRHRSDGTETVLRCVLSPELLDRHGD